MTLPTTDALPTNHATDGATESLQPRPALPDGEADAAESKGPALVLVSAACLDPAPPSRGDALGFSVIAHLGESRSEWEPEGPLRRYGLAEVTVRVNGRGLLLKNDLVFDAMNVLVQQDTPGVQDLYTCSCGEAGCAGLFRGVLQALAQPSTDALLTENAPVEAFDAGDTVVWRFPVAETFEHRLSEGWPVVDGAYELRFERAHFTAALSALREHLESLTARFKDGFQVGMALLPDWNPADAQRTDTPLMARLPELRARFEERQDDLRATRALFGDLFDDYLVVTLSTGRVYTAYPTRVATCLAEAALGEGGTPEALAEAVRAIVLAWRDDRDRVLTSLQQIPHAVRDDAVCLDSYAPDEQDGDRPHTLDEAAWDQAWAGAQGVWRTLEQG